MIRNLETYARAAKSAGVPDEQFRNLVRAGAVLSPVQLLASAAARECDFDGGPDELGYGGARGGGKSHWSLVQMGVDDCQRVSGLKCLLLRKVGKSGQESFEDLRIRTLQRTPHKYSSSSGELEFANGSKIVLGHFKDEKDIDKYLGLQYDIIGIEEDTQLSDTKRSNVKTCLRTAKLDWRPRIYCTTNPGGIGHARFKKQFILPWKRGEQTKTRFIPATFRDNPVLNKEYESVLDELKGWKRRAWKDGDWDIDAGLFFSNWRESVHVVAPFEWPRNWQVWGALDYGHTHYTVFYLFAMSDDGDIYVIAEHAERKQLVPYHAKAIHALLGRFGLTVSDLRKIVAGSDVFANKGDLYGLTIAQQYEAHGIKLEEANTDRINGAGEILDRLGDSEAGIAPRVFIFSGCYKLIECLPSLLHDEKRPEDVLKVDCDPDTGEGGDDPYDGFRYGVMAVAEGSWMRDDPIERLMKRVRNAA